MLCSMGFTRAQITRRPLVEVARLANRMAPARWNSGSSSGIRRAVLLIKRQVWIVHPADEVTDGARRGIEGDVKGLAEQLALRHGRGQAIYALGI
jgi:hypothetical protein